MLKCLPGLPVTRGWGEVGGGRDVGTHVSHNNMITCQILFSSTLLINSTLITNEISLRQILMNTSPPYISPPCCKRGMIHVPCPNTATVTGGKKSFPREKKWTLFHGYSFFSRS